MKTLDNVLKSIGAIPVKPMPKETQTPFQREVDKIKYKIGAIPYKPGQEYLFEPIQWNVIREGLLKKIY